MKTFSEWNLNGMQDSEGLIVNAQYRQPELLQNAGEEHSENNPQSAKTRLDQWLLQVAADIAMSLQSSSLSG